MKHPSGGSIFQEDDENETMEEGSKLLEVVDPHSQESLQSEAVPDPMEGEQTWPTEEELAEAEGKKSTALYLGKSKLFCPIHY